MNTPAERLKWARRQAGFASAAAFARAIGIPEVTYRAHEKGPRVTGGRGLSEAAARSYASTLRVNWAWLLTGEGTAALGRGGSPTTAGDMALEPTGIEDSPDSPLPNAQSEALDIPAPASLPRNLPVRGTAVGGDDGDFEFNGDVVDYVRRPPGIAAARNAFAVYVTGGSMSPRFEAGELVFVHPDRPPVSGSDVLVELHGRDGQPGACYIKRLLRRTPTKIVLQQFNPPRDDIEFALERVRVVYRILTPSELMGI